MALAITGASNEGATVTSQAVALALPVVTKEKLLDVTDPINDTHTSGKKTGGLVLADNAGVLTIVTADGTLTTSLWVTVGTATAVTYATPV